MPRYDVSQVPLQGGYVAKNCPVKAQNDTLQPAEPIPTDPFTQRLFDNGNAFEAEIVAELVASHPDAVVIEGGCGDAEAATLGAMRRALPLIIGGRLPSDQVARRVGKPDLLVIASGGGYHAVDVKWHQNLEPLTGKKSELAGRCSSLDVLQFDRAIVDADYAARRKEEDVLQLAHYQRMLAALDLAAKDGCWGGIIGTERRIVWYDLDAPVWRTPSVTQKTKMRTTMERYDFEFAFRLDIIAVAQQHQVDPSVELLTVPVKISECDKCPWWDYCRPQLEQPPGDVSLLPRIGWTYWKVHRDHGVTNRAELATLDWRTASLVAAKVDVVRLMASVAEADPKIHVADCDGMPAKVVEHLHLLDVVTVGDVHQLDPKTALYSDVGLSALPTQIDLARAALGSEPAYRKRGVSDVVVPRADVEIDVDMENAETGCYLWGTYVTRNSAATSLVDVGDGYRAFVTWEPMTPEVEAANSLEFWRWLMECRAEAHKSGLTFAAYCWNEGAENQYLRRLGIANGIEDEVEEFIASPEWVDLLKVWDSQLITGHSSGLKLVAPLCGFHWAIDDAGGGNSMVQYDVAVTAPTDAEREAAREWMLTYNRGDVEATLAVRGWMPTAVSGIEEAGFS